MILSAGISLGTWIAHGFFYNIEGTIALTVLCVVALTWEKQNKTKKKSKTTPKPHTPGKNKQANKTNQPNPPPQTKQPPNQDPVQNPSSVYK